MCSPGAAWPSSSRSPPRSRSSCTSPRSHPTRRRFPPDRHQYIFPDIEPSDRPPSTRKDMSDKPTWIRSLPRMDEETVQSVDDWFRNRVRMLQAVDEAIAGSSPCWSDGARWTGTYLVFTSDNGFQHGAHRMDHGQGRSLRGVDSGPVDRARSRCASEPGAESLRAQHRPCPDLRGARGFGYRPDWVDGRSLVPLLGPEPPDPAAWRSDFLVEH